MPTDFKIIDVPYHRLDETADVLAKAFDTDPVVSYFLPKEHPRRPEALRALFRFSAVVRLYRQQPLLALEWDNKLVGVANVRSPYSLPWTDSLDRQWAKTVEIIGKEAEQRLDEYSKLQDSHNLPRLHHYLMSIGVDPRYQGMGFGQSLLKGVIGRAADDPTSAGILLDTDGEANIRFYERNGFKRTGTGTLGGVAITFMYYAIR